MHQGGEIRTLRSHFADRPILAQRFGFGFEVFTDSFDRFLFAVMLLTPSRRSVRRAYRSITSGRLA
ncbi:hypothetical protein PN498_04295 [Oscillatoria sp. CS-180]|uniref:hypothetical protein n=1 Tax=Oscillatoria sp. CS-180 TaxID=3021720 RepID=UPI00232C90F9|nr:hypothetical protein [Oscillatoria sp. CS-180]MDB9525196.1 hypothetical protein [Oscillatoria sp. CS-180]